MRKKSLIVALMLAGLFPASILAQSTIPSISCSADVDAAKKKGSLQSQAIQSDSSSCYNQYYYGKALITDGEYLEAQDTLEDFINSCYQLSTSFQAFNYIPQAVAGDGITGDAKWLTLRDWLFSVLYLNLDSNYWGGHDMNTPSTCFSSSTYLHSLSTAPTVSCSDGTEQTKQKKEQPLSVQPPFDSSDCIKIYGEGDILALQDGEFYEAGDTLEYYVEHCYPYEGFRYDAFQSIVGDIAGNHPGGDTLPNLRQWLFSVLYLDTMTEPDGTRPYYCSDAMATVSTFNTEDTFKSNGFASEIAVERYIAESGKCPFYQGMLEREIKEWFQNWHIGWKDTVKDSLLTPWDTTLPTLQQIGFEILLGPQYAAVHNGVIPSNVLGEIGISPNPFVDNTVIDYTLNVPATLTVDVYDQLGHRVTSLVPSVFTNNGEYSFTLSGSMLASGVYYIRFSVPEGEVKTIKVTKE